MDEIKETGGARIGMANATYNNERYTRTECLHYRKFLDPDIQCLWFLLIDHLFVSRLWL